MIITMVVFFFTSIGKYTNQHKEIHDTLFGFHKGPKGAGYLRISSFIHFNRHSQQFIPPPPLASKTFM